MKRLFRKTRNSLRKIRHLRVRAKINGTATKPRLSIFRSNRSINVQLIDDENSKTLFSVNASKVKDGDVGERKGKVAKAYLVGQAIAQQAKEKNITTVVFDRGGYKYQGRVSAVADGARDGGLIF